MPINGPSLLVISSSHPSEPTSGFGGSDLGAGVGSQSRALVRWCPPVPSPDGPRVIASHLASSSCRSSHVRLACFCCLPSTEEKARRREDRDLGVTSTDPAAGSADPAPGSADPAGAVGRRPFLHPIGGARVSVWKERSWAWSCLSGCCLAMGWSCELASGAETGESNRREGMRGARGG